MLASDDVRVEPLRLLLLLLRPSLAQAAFALIAPTATSVARVAPLEHLHRLFELLDLRLYLHLTIGEVLRLLREGQVGLRAVDVVRTRVKIAR